MDGDRELSDAWTGFTWFTILNERPPEGYTWSETSNIKAGSLVARTLGEIGMKCAAEGEAEVVT